MSSIASPSRPSGPSVSGYHDNQPAVGKLRPWTRQKVEARARVKEREQVRRAETAAKKDALAKVQQQPAAQRRADPTFQKAERQTSAQIGKVFAALAGGDERTAGEFCAKLPKLMKPGVDRKTHEDAYCRNIREIADYKVGKMTDAELQAVAKGVDGVTHFSSDAPDLFVLAEAVTKERARRQPQQDTARNACQALVRGALASCLKDVQAARGDRDNRLDWKSTMSEMKDGELMRVLEQFEPENDGGPSAATQLLSSMNFICKKPIGTEHPEIRHAGNDMKAIVTAAWDLLTERGKQPGHLHQAVDQIKKAELSSDNAVRGVLRHGFGVEVSNEQKLIVTCGRAGATVDAKVREDLSNYNANRDKPTDSQRAYFAASTRVRESINMTAATAKSPFVRPDGTPGSLEGDCRSTYTEERTKDGKLFVKCVDYYDNPSFKLPAGSRSLWAPESVKVTYTLQVEKDGTVSLAHPVSVDYFLEQSRTPDSPLRPRTDSLDEVIMITPAAARPLAVASLTPNQQKSQAFRVLGLSEGARPAELGEAYARRLRAATDPAEKQAVVAAYDLLRPKLRDRETTFATDQFDAGALFSAGVETPFFKALHAFAQTEYSEENTAFCIAAEAFDSQRFRDDESYREGWKAVVKDLNVGDEHRKVVKDLNVGDEHRNKLQAAFASADDVPMSAAIAQVKEEIHKLLRADTFRRFITAVNKDKFPSNVDPVQLTSYLREMRSSHPGPAQP